MEAATDTRTGENLANQSFDTPAYLPARSRYCCRVCWSKLLRWPKRWSRSIRLKMYVSFSSFLSPLSQHTFPLAGDIYVWDTGSGTLLLHLPAAPRRGELTCIAWNHAVDDPFMLATGYHDGTVIIWTKPKDNPESKMEVSTIINAGRDMNSGNLSTIMNYCDSRRFEFFMEHAQFHQFPAPTQEQTHEDN
jgi:WD40 repeat protein